jgi:hypothetical protein
MHNAPHAEHQEVHAPNARGRRAYDGAPQEQAPNDRAFHAALRTVDPASLSSTEGAVERFLSNLHGDADGLVLDGQQVHFPPHMSEALTKSIKAGDRVEVRGLKCRGVDVLMALSITATKSKKTFDCAPKH